MIRNHKQAQTLYVPPENNKYFLCQKTYAMMKIKSTEFSKNIYQ